MKTKVIYTCQTAYTERNKKRKQEWDGVLLVNTVISRTLIYHSLYKGVYIIIVS